MPNNPPEHWLPAALRGWGLSWSGWLDNRHGEWWFGAQLLLVVLHLLPATPEPAGLGLAWPLAPGPAGAGLLLALAGVLGGKARRENRLLLEGHPSYAADHASTAAIVPGLPWLDWRS